MLPITELKVRGPGVEGGFGTGFCVDPECRLIGTNYHVSVLTEPRKIKGIRVIHQYLATGPEDEGATMNEGPSMSPMRYNLGRDLAILELRHPPSKYHGMAFSLDELFPGQGVDIYTYPRNRQIRFANLFAFMAPIEERPRPGCWHSITAFRQTEKGFVRDRAEALLSTVRHNRL